MDSRYQLPPPELIDVVDAPLTPAVSLSPDRNRMLLMAYEGLPDIAAVARPESRLAGVRFHASTRTPSRLMHFTSMTLRHIQDGRPGPVTGLPEGGALGGGTWSPDGRFIGLSVLDAEGLSLWVVDAATRAARRATDARLNGIMSGSFIWSSDSRTLICKLVPRTLPGPGGPPAIPEGPVIQENSGKTAPSRTYQDLLKSPYDESYFAHHITCQLAAVGLDGTTRELGGPDLYLRAEPSPDGRYVLIEALQRPFSYLVPYYRFASRVEVWRASGEAVRTVADLPLAEDVPVVFDAVPRGPRAFGWRADAPSELTWVTALDDGDPSQEADVRDRIHALADPFDGDSRTAMDLSLRYAGRMWGTGDIALVSERWWRDRRLRTWRIRPDHPNSSPELIFDRSWEDRYSDPGTPLMCRTAFGTRALMVSGNDLFLAGEGASPEGDQPFLDRFNLETGKAERLFRSTPPRFEQPVTLIRPDSSELLIARERVDESPNYFLKDLDSGAERQVTEFPHPTPDLKDVRKELIRYKRVDGVQLTATLYLPGAHKDSDGPLPLLMWAYPREFKSADAAGQVKDSPHRFVRFSPQSPIPLVTQGYAVLDGPSMPIVGEGDAEANDTYVEQLVASAEAAVDKVVDLGIAEKGRIAVGGHSYGGFMTANLLAHTDLFDAGIARSGAYNRTLTPFGFQAEERTIWEAPSVYASMSPFMHANKISAPLLLIHGEADNNSGTFPMQSERFYNALKGHGATVRLIMLPHESHGYRARESVLHVLWEMCRWLQLYIGG